MKITSILSVFILIQGAWSLTAPKDYADNVRRKFLQNLNLYGFKMLRRIHQLEIPRENLVISPYIIIEMMGTLYLAANGTTFSHIAEQIGMDPFKFFLTEFPQLRQKIKQTKEISLARHLIATSKLKKDFQLSAQYYFESATSDQISCEKVEWSINDWVREETLGSLNDILVKDKPRNETCRPGSLYALTAITFNDPLVKTNGFYKTGSRPFTLADGSHTRTEMITGSVKARVAELKSLKSELVSFPLKDTGHSMVLLVPYNFSEFFQELKLYNLGSMEKVKEIRVSITIPLFTIKSTLSLRTVLQLTGVFEMFGPNVADFSNGCSPLDSCYVHSFLHGASVSLDEHCGVDGCQTDENNEQEDDSDLVIFSSKEVTPPSLDEDEPEDKDIRVDKPFIFFILHEESGVVIFTGVYGLSKEQRPPYPQEHQH